MSSTYFLKFDISSAEQLKNGVSAFTLIPNKVLTHAFFDSIGVPNEECCQLKLRLYVRELSKDTVVIRAVPIAIVGALNFDSIDELFQSIVSHLEHSERFSNAFVETSSKYRLIQFALANCFGDFSFRLFSQEIQRDIYFKNNPEALNLIFSKPSIELVNELLEVLPSIKFGKINIANSESTHDVDYSPESFDSQNTESILGALLAPFTWLYHNKELPSRAKVKEDGVLAIESQENNKTGRLSTGFSYSFLLNIVKDVTKLNSNLILLPYLDKLIDTGVVVPVTITASEHIYRGFRHGEDVVFGAEEERLSYLLLKEFSNAQSKEHLNRLETERMLVLFLQIGLRGNNAFLEPYTSDTRIAENAKIASVKYYLHGPIVVQNSKSSNESGTPYLQSDKTSTGLIRRISSPNRNDRNPVFYDVKSKTYHVKNESELLKDSNSSIQLFADKELEVVNLGKMMGGLVGNFRRRALLH
ncbi:MAG: hypothetical protein JKY22_00245 [Flavobacteriaceae bacterium]|nr:hypothetical protein [Flavobacteriaceae bacterium]